MIKKNIKKLAFPTLAIGGASLLLFIILTILSVQNYNREKQLVQQQLYQQGTTLIKVLESSIEYGMMNMQWKQNQIQTLLNETAKEPSIAYIMLVDNNGVISIHSQAQYTGNKVIGILLPQKANNKISIISKNTENEDIFNVTKVIAPLSPLSLKPNNSSRWNRCMDRWNNSLTGKYIIVGLKMNEYKEAQEEDIRRAIISALILMILGSASLYFLFVIQSYYVVNKTLKSLETYTANVVNSMPNGLISLDSKGRITTLNQNAAKLLGLTFSETEGQTLDKLMKKCNLSDTLLPTSDIFEQQMECHLNDGRIIPLSTTSSLLKNEKGEIIGKVIILRDLQDIKTLEKKIERSERLASLGRMAAGIAHEIRNPLSSIKGFALYFRSKFKQDSEDYNYAAVMANEVDRLNRVIQDMLNFAKPQEPKFTNVNILEIIEHTLKLMESDLREKNIQVFKDFDITLPYISADKDMITQILLNIFINAVEAMKKGNKLTIQLQKSEEGIRIIIKDTGLGIIKTDLHKIFDPFFTLKSGGTGLGLAIVHRIVENHHGEIEVISELEKGTTFRIYLPLKQK